MPDENRQSPAASITSHLYALLSPTEDGEVLFSIVNLDQVRLVDEIRENHCRLWFSETHMLTVDGSGAPGIIKILVDRSIAMDGVPVRGFLENAINAALNPSAPRE